MERRGRVGLLAALVVLASCSSTGRAAPVAPEDPGAGGIDTTLPGPGAVPGTAPTAAAAIPRVTDPTTTTTNAPAAWVTHVAPGSCLAEAAIDPGAIPAVVDCGAAHDAEVLEIVVLAGDDRPEGHVLSAIASRTCDAAVAERHLGAAIAAGLLTTATVVPAAAEWAAGERRVACLLQGSSLRGPARSDDLLRPAGRLAAVGVVDGVAVVQLRDVGTGALVRTIGEPIAQAQVAPPGWNAAGNLLLYAAGPETQRTLHAAAIDADVATILTDVHGAGMPRLDPSGSRLAFVATGTGGEYDVMVLDLVTRDVTALVAGPDRDTSPSWSPDGTRLAIRSRVDGNSDVWLVAADGSGATRITTDPGFDGDPVWSPDGKHIAFTSDRGGSFDIWVMGADGSDQRPLTTHPASDGFPSWSPDGSVIAFQSDRLGTDAVWLMRADGSGATLLTADAPLGSPSFAPVPG